MTQSGLPEGDRIEVVLSDPAPTTTRLATATTTSGPGGTIDVRFTVSLRGHTRLHVEVEDLDRHAEYGETGTDLGDRCGSPNRTLRLALVGALLLPVAAFGGWFWRRRRRPAPTAA